MAPDTRTTRSELRIPILLLLLALGGYNVWCWRNALGTAEPSRVRWFATWQMFTLRDPGHSELYAQARVGEAWRDIDLGALFPTKWESGPRYARSSFWKSSSRMHVLAASTCTRHPDRPTRVRFRVERWDRTLGELEQPKRGKKTEVLLDWSCDRAVPLPKGRLL